VGQLDDPPAIDLNPNSCLGLVAARARTHKAGSTGEIAEQPFCRRRRQQRLARHLYPSWPIPLACRLHDAARNVVADCQTLPSTITRSGVMEATGGFEARALELIAAVTGPRLVVRLEY
jgi:hypothetical protein